GSHLAGRNTAIGGICGPHGLFACLGDEGIERARALDRRHEGAGQFLGRNLLGPDGIARLGQGHRSQFGHYSTTFGTTKKCASPSGALAIRSSAWPPSVTRSSRHFRRWATTLVMGGTPSTFTSPSISTHWKMPLSSAVMGSRRLSRTASRASLATRRTVSLSTDMRFLLC